MAPLGCLLPVPWMCPFCAGGIRHRGMPKHNAISVTITADGTGDPDDPHDATPYWWDDLGDLISVPEPAYGEALLLWVRPRGQKRPCIGVRVAYTADLQEKFKSMMVRGVRMFEWCAGLRMWLIRDTSSIGHMPAMCGNVGITTYWYTRGDVDFPAPDLKRVAAYSVRRSMGETDDQLMSPEALLMESLRQEPGGRVACLRGIDRLRVKIMTLEDALVKVLAERDQLRKRVLWEQG